MNDTISLLNLDNFVNPFIKAKKIVIKLGSSLITNNGQSIDEKLLAHLAGQIQVLKSKNIDVILVSSGAVASGMSILKITSRPKQIHDLQATSAIGQMHLMHMYKVLFEPFNILAAQVLLTHADFSDRERYLNARGTLNTLINMGAVPIINENDAIVNDEIRFGDNDTLGALVSSLIDADILCILTDQKGIYTADPRKDKTAKLITHASALDKNLAKFAGAAGSIVGTGGMLTKVLAAYRAAQSGVHTCIAYGKEENILINLINGQNIGSLLLSNQTRKNARKQWMKDHLKLGGHVLLDEGAFIALSQGKSLLPVGITQVQGNFLRGDVIACYFNGKEVGRGISQYNSTEVKLIAKHSSSDIFNILGYSYASEIIHRNDLVLIK